MVLDDADLQTAVATDVVQCMTNSGQICVAPTRMLIPRDRYEQAVAIAAATANAIAVGEPSDPATKMGPISNRAQYEKVQRMIGIGIGIDESARVVAGGLGRPNGLDRGFYSKPTILADVCNDMAVAREETFGPVLC